MSFDEKIRKLSIQALSSNDELFEKLVLKGGNVLAMVYGLNNRTSSDLDYSIQGSLSAEEKARYEEIIRKTLEITFRDEGFVVFDYVFKEKPKTPQDIRPCPVLGWVLSGV